MIANIIEQLLGAPALHSHRDQCERGGKAPADEQKADAPEGRVR